jgi:chorismate mutase
MQVLKGELAILMIIVIGGMGRPQPQSARDKLQPLVETLARRLAIAKQVALAKWDSQAPVEDAAREARVIAAAIRVHRERPSTLAHGSDYPSRWRRGDVIGKQKSHERKPGKEARPAGNPLSQRTVRLLVAIVGPNHEEDAGGGLTKPPFPQYDFRCR